MWYDAFQARGYNLDEVIDGFVQLLDEEIIRNKTLLATLPRLRGAAEFTEQMVFVSVLGEPPKGWEIVCRFRHRRDSSDQNYIIANRTEDKKFFTTLNHFPNGRAWYQTGLHDGRGNVMYEPWVELHR